MAPQVLNIMREKECHVDVLLFLCCIVVTHVEFPPAPPIRMPNCVCSWAFFLKPRVPARVRADSCGLRPGARTPGNARFHSLLAIPRSSLAPLKWPEVRKGHPSGPYKSIGYARTNQAVDFQHRQAEEPAPIRRMENAVFAGKICSCALHTIRPPARRRPSASRVADGPSDA